MKFMLIMGIWSLALDLICFFIKDALDDYKVWDKDICNFELVNKIIKILVICQITFRCIVAFCFAFCVVGFILFCFEL